MNNIYKFIIAVAITPLLYLVHAAIDRYPGHEFAVYMAAEAHPDSHPIHHP